MDGSYSQERGYPTDNLEETFLAMIEEDNLRRGSRAYTA